MHRVQILSVGTETLLFNYSEMVEESVKVDKKIISVNRYCDASGAFFVQ